MVSQATFTRCQQRQPSTTSRSTYGSALCGRLTTRIDRAREAVIVAERPKQRLGGRCAAAIRLRLVPSVTKSVDHEEPSLDPSLHELLDERPPLNQQNLAPAPAAQQMAWTHPASLPTFRPIGVRRAEPGTDFAEIDSSYCPYPAPAPAVPAPAPAILPPSAPATAPPPPTPPGPANAQSFIPVAASPIRGSNEPTLRPIVPGTGPGGLFNGGGRDVRRDPRRAAEEARAGSNGDR